MRRLSIRHSLSASCALLAAAVAAAPALAAAPGPALALPPFSFMTVLVLLGGAFSLGFFAVAFLIDQLKEGGAPPELKMALGGIGAGGLAVTALLFILTWPGHGYPDPEPERLWAPELQQARLQGLAGLEDYAPPAAPDGRYAIPIGRAMQKLVDDPSLLAGREIVMASPWEETPLVERGRLLYEGLAPSQTSTISGYAACKMCHSIDGTRILGPTFQGRWGLPAATSAGSVTFDEAYVIESTREPNAKVADGFPPIMPAMGLTDEQIEAIIAFLKTL